MAGFGRAGPGKAWHGAARPARLKAAFGYPERRFTFAG
jgi:hypothetical protein